MIIWKSVMTVLNAKQIQALTAEIERRKSLPLYALYPNNPNHPYGKQKFPKQMEFFKGTKDHVINYLRGCNRGGKSVAGAAILAYIVTGEYPADWEGIVIDEPHLVWIVGVNHEMMRDSIQECLIKNIAGFGKGMLPEERIEVKRRSKPADSVELIKVKHRKGHWVNIVTKTHEMSVDAFQAAKVDLILFDEEPPWWIYQECLKRVLSGKVDGMPGRILITATPLKGLTKFVKSLRDDKSGMTKVTVMTIDDIHHLSPEDRKVLENTDPKMRRAVLYADPYIGAGMIWDVNSAEITCPSMSSIPRHWNVINGLDTGHRTAAVFMAQDPMTKQVIVYAEKYFEFVPLAVKAMELARISRAPYVADTASKQVSERDLVGLDFEYKQAGLKLWKPNKQLKQTMIEKAGNGLKAGTIKICENCVGLLDAIFEFTRDIEGKIAETESEHYIDAFLYGLQLIDSAVPYYTVYDPEYQMMERLKKWEHEMSLKSKPSSRWI